MVYSSETSVPTHKTVSQHTELQYEVSKRKYTELKGGKGQVWEKH
jgi:hypothetical protein